MRLVIEVRLLRLYDSKLTLRVLISDSSIYGVYHAELRNLNAPRSRVGTVNWAVDARRMCIQELLQDGADCMQVAESEIGCLETV